MSKVKEQGIWMQGTRKGRVERSRRDGGQEAVGLKILSLFRSCGSCGTRWATCDPPDCLLSLQNCGQKKCGIISADLDRTAP